MNVSSVAQLQGLQKKITGISLVLGTFIRSNLKRAGSLCPRDFLKHHKSDKDRAWDDESQEIPALLTHVTYGLSRIPPECSH